MSEAEEEVAVAEEAPAEGKKPPKNPSRRKLMKLGLQVGGVAALAGLYVPNRWNYIVIHHSKGNSGSVEYLQKIHKDRKRDFLDAMSYHYVVGNGRGGLKMGEIASDWRKEYNIWGAHMSSNNKDRNFRGLGICAIGDFHSHYMQEAQYQSLRTLTTRLMLKYNIPIANLSTHRGTDGEKGICPGKYFPTKRLFDEIKVDLKYSGIV